MTRLGCGPFRVVSLQTLFLALAAHPLSAGPLLPSGPEIQVGVSSSTGSYYRDGQPRVAVFPDGGFVVVWQGPGGVRARLFHRDGVPQTGELQLLRPYNQLLEGVATVPGGFVVVWDQDNHHEVSVFAAVFDRSAARLVPPFKVHANSPFDRYWSRLAATPDGGFVVAWQADSGKTIYAAPPPAGNNHSDVFARFFAADGTPRTPEILVVRGLSYLEGGTLDGPSLNAISAARDGSVEVAMDGPDGPVIWLARLSEQGRVFPSPYGVLPSFDPTLATAPDGSFTLAATNPRVYYSRFPSDILAVRFHANGKSQGELQLNFRGRFEVQAHLAYLPDGSLVAIWTDTRGRDGDGDGVYGRVFAADGTSFGPDFRVNSTTAGDQAAVDLAATPDGAAIALYTRGISAGGGVPIVARFLRPSP